MTEYIQSGVILLNHDSWNVDQFIFDIYHDIIVNYVYFCIKYPSNLSFILSR